MCPHMLVLLWEIPLYNQVNGSVIQLHTDLYSAKDATEEVSFFKLEWAYHKNTHKKGGSMEVLQLTSSSGQTDWGQSEDEQTNPLSVRIIKCFKMI